MAPGISLDDRNAWDDSALIDSWEEALAEYKKYHSIHAQGKRLEDVLGEDELQELRKEHRDVLDTETIKEEPTFSGENANNHADQMDTEETAASVSHANNLVDQIDTDSYRGVQASQPVTQAEEQAASEQQKSAPAVPAGPLQAMLVTVPDENLRNLMMSWYYAGYYTGLYTGQQQQPGV